MNLQFIARSAAASWTHRADEGTRTHAHARERLPSRGGGVATGGHPVLSVTEFKFKYRVVHRNFSNFAAWIGGSIFFLKKKLHQVLDNPKIVLILYYCITITIMYNRILYTQYIIIITYNSILQ